MDKHECVERMKNLTKARCGLAFVEYLLRDDRLKATKTRSVHNVDLKAGFTTAAGILGLIPSEECVKMSKIARSISRKLGDTGVLDKKNIVKIRNKANGMATKVEEMIRATDLECTGEAAVGSSCGCRR